MCAFKPAAKLQKQKAVTLVIVKRYQSKLRLWREAKSYLVSAPCRMVKVLGSILGWAR
jgi:hypothetical protein